MTPSSALALAQIGDDPSLSVLPVDSRFPLSPADSGWGPLRAIYGDVCDILSTSLDESCSYLSRYLWTTKIVCNFASCQPWTHRFRNYIDFVKIAAFYWSNLYIWLFIGLIRPQARPATELFFVRAPDKQSRHVAALLTWEGPTASRLLAGSSLSTTPGSAKVEISQAVGFAGGDLAHIRRMILPERSWQPSAQWITSGVAMAPISLRTHSSPLYAARGSALPRRSGVTQAP